MVAARSVWPGISPGIRQGLFFNNPVCPPLGGPDPAVFDHGRQTCLAHLIRKADGLCERKKPELKQFGQIMAGDLRQLVQFSN